MRIGFDAKRAYCNARGLGNYSRTLIESVAKEFPENDYFLFTPRTQKGLKPDLPSTTKAHLVLPNSAVGRWLGSPWRSFVIPREVRKRGLDVYHGLSNEIPMSLGRQTRWILTVTDLIFLRFPELFPQIDRWGYSAKVRWGCKHADKIIAISEQTKRDLVEWLKVDEKKIHVVYLAVDPVFETRLDKIALSDFLRKRGLPEKFILFVGTLEKRKNAALLVDAFARVTNSIPEDLVLVGKKGDAYAELKAQVEKLGVESRVHWVHDLKGSELPAIYQAASVSVYPSFFEGFGIPIIESLASRTPVLASNTAACQEAGGNAARYFDPRSVDDLARLLKEHAPAPEKIVEEHLKKFSTQTLAREVASLWT